MLIVAILAAALVAVGYVVLLDARADLKEAEAEARFPPEGELVSVGGRAVHAVVKGSGPDLVLIHGASGNTRDFTFSLMDALSERYRVIAMDRPGMGWSERAADHYGGALNTRAESPVEQARILAAAARKLGAERPLVLGHSYGGAVAMAWALEEPAAGVIVVAGATMPWKGGLGTLYAINASALGGAQVVPLLTAFPPRTQIDRTLEAIFAPQPVPEGYGRHVGVGLSLRRESMRANARQVNGLKPHVREMSERYAGLDLPVEIVHGTADDIVPHEVHAVPMAEIVEGARLTLLDGVGHMPHHVVPDDIVDAVDRAAARAGLP